jgi:soluble lytic murein transglycosylase
MRASNEHNVPMSLLLKVLRAEGGGSGVVSRKGAMGPMQLMPDLVRSYGEDPQRALHDEELNLTLGTRYLSKLLNHFGGSEPHAMAAYNAGPTRLSEILRTHGRDWRRQVPSETDKYLRRVGY